MLHYGVLHSVDCWFKVSDTRLCLWNKRVDAVWEEGEKKQEIFTAVPSHTKQLFPVVSVVHGAKYASASANCGVGGGGEGEGGITIKQSASIQKSLGTRPLQNSSAAAYKRWGTVPSSGRSLSALVRTLTKAERRRLMEPVHCCLQGRHSRKPSR